MPDQVRLENRTCLPINDTVRGIHHVVLPAKSRGALGIFGKICACCIDCTLLIANLKFNLSKAFDHPSTALRPFLFRVLIKNA